MATKPSQSRYDAGGRVLWLVYSSPQALANGRRTERTRVKRLYFPGDVRDVELSSPRELVKRNGRHVFGVEVRYVYRYNPHRRVNRRGDPVTQRWTRATKVIELPEEASRPHLTLEPPAGPKLSVA